MIIARCIDTRVTALIHNGRCRWHYDGVWRVQDHYGITFQGSWLVSLFENMADVDVAWLRRVLDSTVLGNFSGAWRFVVRLSGSGGILFTETVWIVNGQVLKADVYRETLVAWLPDSSGIEQPEAL